MANAMPYGFPTSPPAVGYETANVARSLAGEEASATTLYVVAGGFVAFGALLAWSAIVNAREHEELREDDEQTKQHLLQVQALNAQEHLALQAQISALAAQAVGPSAPVTLYASRPPSVALLADPSQRVSFMPQVASFGPSVAPASIPALSAAPAMPSLAELVTRAYPAVMPSMGVPSAVMAPAMSVAPASVAAYSSMAPTLVRPSVRTAMGTMPTLFSPYPTTAAPAPSQTASTKGVSKAIEKAVTKAIEKSKSSRRTAA